MRRYAPLAMLLCVPAFAALTLLSGCAGGDEKKPESAPAGERKERKKKTGGAVAELEAPTDGVLKGRVVLDGDAPKIEMIAAMAAHTDAKTCLMGSEDEKIAQEWLLSPDKKGVANVVIKLLPPEGKKFKNIPPAEKEVVIDQPHCAFVPHVSAVRPGQVLLVKNSANVPHNTKMAVDPVSGNQDVKETIPAKGSLKPLELNFQKGPIVVSCDFHNWMRGYVYVNDSPYIAVTKEDGTYEIPNVPTGVELTVVGIHEAGEVEGGKTGQKRTFKAGANDLDLKVKPR